MNSRNKVNFDKSLYFNDEDKIRSRFDSIYQSSELKLLLKRTQTFEQLLEQLFSNEDLISQIDTELKQMLSNSNAKLEEKVN